MLNTLSPIQLNSLNDIVKKSQAKKVLDLGSGNGELLVHICNENSIKGIGIDFSYLPPSNKFCSFIKSDHEDFNLNDKFDLILSIDSSYMIGDFKRYLKNIIDHLHPNASALFFMTFTDTSLESSPFIKACKKLKINPEIIDFTNNDYEFWQNSKKELDALNQEFVDEEHFNLWNIKYKEVLKNLELHQENRTKRYQILIRK